MDAKVNAWVRCAVDRAWVIFIQQQISSTEACQRNGVYIKLEMQGLGQGANGKTKGAMEGAFHFRFAASFIWHMAAKVKLDCYLDMCTLLRLRLRGFRARTIAVVPLFADDR